MTPTDLEPWLEPVARALCLDIARDQERPDREQFVERYWRNCDDAARAAYDALKRLGAIRTPGTVEVCAYEAEHVDHGRCPDDESQCKQADCPIRKGDA